MYTLQYPMLRIADTAATVHVSLDYAMFRVINSAAGHHPALDAIMIAAARYSPIFLALVLAILWLTWKSRNQRGALLAGLSGLIALGLGQIVGILFPRDRPYLAHHVTLLVPHAPDTSFPSDHATLAFAVAVMILQFNRRLGGALLALGVLIAVARVFIGAHYPTDVIGGAVLGSVTSVVIQAAVQHAYIARLLDRLMLLLARLRLAAPTQKMAGLGTA
jgi:undecaprenyl-diphosphatase